MIQVDHRSLECKEERRQRCKWIKIEMERMGSGEKERAGRKKRENKSVLKLQRTHLGGHHDGQQRPVHEREQRAVAEHRGHAAERQRRVVRRGAGGAGAGGHERRGE
jgi:hypothetical protein